MKVQIFVAFVGCLPFLHAFPGGPPTSACENMTPNHGANGAQTSEAPYTITVNSNTYTMGENIEVTVAATGTPFKGFFIQARSAGSNNAVGAFSLGSETEIQLLTCPGGTNNAVSHTTRADKTTKTFLWSSDAGSDIYFQATFVQNFATFWTNVRSATVQANTTGITTMAPATTTAGVGSITSSSAIISLLLVVSCMLHN